MVVKVNEEKKGRAGAVWLSKSRGRVWKGNWSLKLTHKTPWCYQQPHWFHLQRLCFAVTFTWLIDTCPLQFCGQPETLLPPLTTALHTRVSAVSPQALHDSPPLHLCRHFPELSHLAMAKIKRQINGVAWWQESDFQFWDRIQCLCRRVQYMLCLPA